MTVAGIIAEYNPFHRGHQYHIEKTRELTGADYILVIMSGDFTQRGQAAMMDKYSRAKQALLNGADLVLELPLCFATSSAKIFAWGAVSLLDSLGVADYLSFGSEIGSMMEIQQLAHFFAQEPEDYQRALQDKLKQGLAFPKARALALRKFFPQFKESFFSSPNNILGIEYCCALLALHSSIKPITIKRIHGAYHDKTLSQVGYSSATAIRTGLNTGGTSVLKEHLPPSVYQIITEEYGRSLPLETNDFSGLLHYQLLMSGKEELASYADVHQELADRIYNHLYSFQDYEGFCDLLKTKELTRSRISRGLLHILLGIKEQEIKPYNKPDYVGYGRILGFRKNAAPLLHEIKVNSRIPLLSKLADASRLLASPALSMLETDIRGSHIYESILAGKFSTPFQNEYQRQFPIV